MPTPSPPPPSQQQANEAQQARYAAELAILPLFEGEDLGAGAGEDEESTLHVLRVVAILAALSAAIEHASFRERVGVDHEQVSESIEKAALREYHSLADSELDDRQKAVLWATWTYSEVANEIAASINKGEISNAFANTVVGLKKVWISRSDHRVRPLHVKLHGKTVPIDGDFHRWVATGQRLRWPGDRNAPPEATYGCRCVCLLTWASQDEVSEMIHQIVEHTKKSEP